MVSRKEVANAVRAVPGDVVLCEAPGGSTEYIGLEVWHRCQRRGAVKVLLAFHEEDAESVALTLLAALKVRRDERESPGRN